MSPVTIADGILGLEATHQWAGGVILNSAVAPRARILKITGLHGLPEADDNRGPRTGRRGEQIYPSHARGRTIVYEGVIEARTLQQTRAAAQTLRSAFSDRYREHTMVVAPHPAYGTVAHEFAARVLDFSCDDEQVASPQATWRYGRGWQLSLRQGDGRYYVSGWQTVNADAGEVVHAHNLGGAPTDPFIDVAGPVAGGDVTVMRGDGLKLVFRDVTVPGGTVLRVDFLRRSATVVSTGEDVTGHIDISDSNWWDEAQDGLRAGIDEGVVAYGGGQFWVNWRHANP